MKNVRRTVPVAAFCLAVAAGAAGMPSAWTSIGPDGGTVDFVAAAFSAPQTVYASSKLGGVFASADSGATWRSANAGLSDLRIQCLAVSPNDPLEVYAGAQAGGFKTTDGGASWTPLANGFPAALVNSIAIDPSNTSTVYAAGTSGALVKSTNSGASWASIGSAAVASAQPRIVAVDPSHSSTLYLGTLQGGMFRSSDGGRAWTAQNTGLTDQVGNVYAVNALAVDPANPSHVLAGTAANGVFLSTDSGATWAASNDGIGQLTLVTGIVFGPDGTAYMSQQQGLYLRPPGSASWVRIDSPSNYVNAVSVGSSAPPVYIGFGKLPFDTGGFARWEGGTSFAQFRPALLVVSALAADPGSPGRALVATTSDTFVYQPGGPSGPWTPPFASGGGNNPGDVPPITLYFDPRHPGVVYSGGIGRVFKSTDGGSAEWVSASAGIPSTPPTIVRSFIALPASTQGLLAGTSSGLYQSSDGAASWSPGSADLSARQIFALAADPAAPAMLWAGTDDGVYKSTDSGEHWSRAGAALGGAVHAVLVAPGSPERVLAGADTGLFASTDAGATWQPAGVGAAVNALVRNPTSGALLAGTLSGVFESVDGGTVWAAENEDLGNPDVLCLAVLSNGTVLAGTNGGSVFERIRTADREPAVRPVAPGQPRALTARP